MGPTRRDANDLVDGDALLVFGERPTDGSWSDVDVAIWGDVLYAVGVDIVSRTIGLKSGGPVKDLQITAGGLIVATQETNVTVLDSDLRVRSEYQSTGALLNER